MKLKNYFENYYPRLNLLTSRPIQFKSIEQYFTTDFDTKQEFIEWSKYKTKQDISNYLINYLINRKQYKSTSSMPGQFESRSICFPAISYILKNWKIGFLREIADKSGLPIKYDYNVSLEYDNSENTILVDTREQTPLFNSHKNREITKLDEGDYQLKRQIQKISIDRKSLNDCIGTISQGYDRFKREIERAKDKGIYLVMVVETSFNNLSTFNSEPRYRKMKISSDFIFHRIRELLGEYDNFQVVCVHGREKTEETIEKILKLKTPIHTIDLQAKIDLLEI